MRSYWELNCPHCGFRTVCGPSGMLDWLRQHGMLKREKQPEAAYVEQLFQVTAGRFQCPSCRQVGLAVAEADEGGDEQWGVGRICLACRRPIDPQRLASLPHAQHCTDCQRTLETTGEAGQDDEYCPKCGTPMQLVTSRGPALTRYRWKCPACGTSRL